MTPLFQAEQALFERINQMRSPLLDQLSTLLSSSAWPWLIAGALIFYALSNGGREGRITALMMVLALGGTHALSGALKEMVQRPAPKDAVVGTHYRETTGQAAVLERPLKHAPRAACPSTEAATVFAAVGVLSVFYFKWWLLLLPLLSGWAQLYTGAHRPGDVLFGWLLGLIAASIVYRFRASRGRPRRVLEEYHAHLTRRR